MGHITFLAFTMTFWLRETYSIRYLVVIVVKGYIKEGKQLGELIHSVMDMNI